MKRRRLPRSRLLLKVYLYGVLLLALAGGASFLIGRYVISTAVEMPARPATAWIAWHLLENVDDPLRTARELADLKKRAHVELTLFDADGRVIVSSGEPPLAALPAEKLAQMRGHGTQFGTGDGTVVLRDESGKLLRYARVTFPKPELPLGSAIAQLAAALLVLAVLSIPLARSVTAPLERLGRLARAFGSGELSARSGLESGDEIGDLARALDDMAERVVELRRTEKELLANVSHELRTPLARIRMALELVREGDSTRGAGYLTDIEEDLGELESLLDDVMTAARLELSRGGAGDALPPLRRRLISGRELVEAARARFEKRVPGRRLNARVGADAPQIDADPSLLRRVLDNLLDNAAKFSEPDTSIELDAVRGETGALVIDVRDRGIGIDSGELARVFEPFYRTDRSRARSTGGVGLGLTLVRRIVEEHGGSITVESELEKGSRFRVSVPGVRA